MPKKIRMSLNPQDIKRVQDELKDYEKRLVTKCNVLCGRLADIGISVAKANIKSAPLGTHVHLDLKYEHPRNGCKAILMATGDTINTPSGSINALLMIEFGSGIHFNHEQNPKADDYGMGVGTYPGQTHAFQEEGWYYMDDSGNWHHTYGVKATMPMYNADIEIITNIHKVAREVFSK